MPGVDVEMPGVDVEMPLGSVFCQITKYLKLFNLASGHHPQIAKYRFLWQDHKPLEATPAKMTKVDPPPAKKLKRSQPVSYASADIEAFFLSPKTTAPDVQNPGINFVTICHLKCT